MLPHSCRMLRMEGAGQGGGQTWHGLQPLMVSGNVAWVPYMQPRTYGLGAMHPWTIRHGAMDTWTPPAMQPMHGLRMKHRAQLLLPSPHPRPPS